YARLPPLEGSGFYIPARPNPSLIRQREYVREGILGLSSRREGRFPRRQRQRCEAIVHLGVHISPGGKKSPHDIPVAASLNQPSVR
ncbi:MAG: hypothetical protein ABSD21_12455, partial [Rhizomicrobium sp.]